MLKELQEKRGLLVIRSRELLNKAESESRKLNPVEKKEYDKNLAGIDKLSLEIDEEQEILEEAGVTKLDQVTIDKLKDSNLGNNRINKDTVFYDKSTLKELRQKLTGSRPGDKQLSLGKVIRSIITGDDTKLTVEERDAISTTAGGGQWLVKTAISGILIPLALNKARVIEAGAKYIDMPENSLIVPKLTKMPIAEWKAENMEFSADTEVNFEGLLLTAKTLMCLVKIPMELALDGQNVESIIENAMSQAIALTIDKNCIDGNGVGQPLGVVNTENVQTEDVNNIAFTNYDHFSSAFYKVEAENGTVTALIGPSKMFGELDLLKDSELNPLRPPESWEKYKRLSSNQLSLNAVIGDWSKLLIGMRNRAILDVTKEAGDSFSKLQIWIRIFTRLDSAISIPEHFCILKDIGTVSS